jgi:hypothetical protein
MTTHDLSRTVWFDETSGTIFVSIDRVTISIYPEELIEVIDDLQKARSALEARDDITLGIDDDGEKAEEVLLFTPDKEYN